MIVTLTPTAECNGLYVVRKDATGFVVRELMQGTSSASFDWQVVVKRRGYEDVRLEEHAPAATREEMESQSTEAPPRLRRASAPLRPASDAPSQD